MSLKSFRMLFAVVVVLVPGTRSLGQETNLRVAIIPDTQNYVTAGDPNDGANGATMANRQMLLEQMVSAIITWRPAFVIQVGDMTDFTGGCDQISGGFVCQTGAGRIADDPNSYPDGYWREWDRIKTQLFNRLDAAGIPHFEVIGNHDSCLEFERWFPAASFLTKPWGYAVDSRPSLCGSDTGFGGGGPTTDTSHRAALFQTA